MVIYLHGFASSPHSSKATFLGQRLRDQGVELCVPDLNLPDFSTLTITRMLRGTIALIDRAEQPVTLIGSSLGGFVAVLAAAQRSDRTSRIVLLAPALDFGGNRMRELGEEGLADWKKSGWLNVFHYGYGRMVPVHYGLYEDARQYDALDAVVDMPVLLFQGRHDDTVEPEIARRWAARRPNVELHMLDDGHQLAASMPFIWKRLREFLKESGN